MPTRKEILQTKINDDLATGTSITAAEHRGVESAIMNAAIPVNRGWFSGLNINDTIVGTYLPVSGDINIALVIRQIDISIISVYFTSMITNNYIVKAYIESTGSDPNLDAGGACPTFKVISPTNAHIAIKEVGEVGAQNIKIHLEVVSLDY